MANAQALIAQQRPRTPVDIFMGKVLTVQDRDEMQRALPRHVSFDRFERNLVNAVMNEPRLLTLEPRLVCREAMKIAALGLLIDAQLGEAYLIASRTGPQARIGYRGLLKLARQSGQVAKIYAEKVHANDKVAGKLGTNKFLEHEPDFFGDRGEVVGFYAVIVFKDGETDFEAMNVHEVNAIRDRSDGWKAFKSGAIKDTPWNSSYEEMGRKTVIRRLLKRSPQSPDLLQAFQVEDEGDHPALASTPEVRQLPVRNPLADEDPGPAIEQQTDQPEQVDPETGEVTAADQRQESSASDRPVQQQTIRDAEKAAETVSQATRQTADLSTDPAPKQTRKREKLAQADPVSEQIAEVAKPAEPAAAALETFVKGCQAATDRGALEAHRDRHRSWCVAPPEGGEDFKAAEAAYVAAVARLDDEERSRTEEEAAGDPEASRPAETEQAAEVQQISTGEARSEPIPKAISNAESWDELIPEGDWDSRAQRFLTTAAKGFFKCKNYQELRFEFDALKGVAELRSKPDGGDPKVLPAFQEMYEARAKALNHAFKPGD